MAKLKDSTKSYLFERLEKDQSQIQTKQNATGFSGLREMKPRCVAMYPDDEGNLVAQTLRYVKGETDLRISHQRKDIKRSQEKPIQWIDGHLLVTAFDALLLKFIENHSRYEGNDNRDTSQPPLFKMIDKDAIKKKELDTAKTLIEAEAIAYDMYKNDGEGFISLCEALSVNTDQDADLMLHSLLVRIRRNPELFLKQLKDPTMKAKAFIKNAVKNGVIKIVGNSVTWGDGSPTGFTCPIGENVEDAFILWFEDKKGKAVYEQIKFRLKNPIEQL